MNKVSSPLQNNIVNLQNILNTINNLPDAGGIQFPTLTNEGTAADLVSGKQLIDGNGNIIIGTHVCESDNSDTERVPVLNANYPEDLPNVTAGGSATFNVFIDQSGNPAVYSYQWYVNGSAVTGATQSSYTRNNVAAGTYTVYCVVTNDAGSVQSRIATLTASAFYLFKSGSGLASGYNGFSINSTGASGSVVADYNQIYIDLTEKAGYEGTYFYSNQPIDVTNYNTMVMDGVTITHSGATGYSTWIYIGLSPEMSPSNGYSASKQISTSIGSNGTFINNGEITIDISGLKGTFYFGGIFGCSDEDATYLTGTIKNIYFT
jgi:hypothetical protein